MRAFLFSALFALVSGAFARAQLKAFLRDWHKLRAVLRRLATREALDRHIAAIREQARRN